MTFDIQLGVWDLILVVAVSLQGTVLAYLPQPRLKALLFTIPVPFTVIALGLGRPLAAGNVLALVVVIFYTQSVRFLHCRMRLGIVPAIALSLLGYCLIGWAGAQVVPCTPAAFWLASAGTLTVGLILYLLLPPRSEPEHRTRLPVWKKLPLILAVVFLLVVVKEELRGFATVFPLLGVVGAYEGRHCLWTLALQVPIVILGLVPLMVVTYLLQDHLGLAPSLLMGWVVFLSVLALLTRRQWASRPAD